MKRKHGIVILAFTLGIGMVVFAFALLNHGADSVDTTGFPVFINEIMSSNKSYYDARGNAYDWIELYNGSDLTISLSQYKLTDNERKVRHVFPRGARIPAKGYYVVWCRNNDADEAYADFSISKAGSETLILMNSRSVIIDRVVTLPLEQDTVMSRDEDGGWRTLDYGTPGFANTQEGYLAYLSAHSTEAFPVRLNEVMASNHSYLDGNGRSSDWIELYNDSDDPVELAGFRLSDRPDANGYVFPEGSVLAGRGYLVVRCDGGVADAYYAPFSLSSAGGEEIAFTDAAGTVLDRVTTRAMQTDSAFVRGENGDWQAGAEPTPGFENSASGRAAYLMSLGRPGADIRITELMASNLGCLRDEDGDFSDWIEIANFGSAAVNLGGCFLSDREDRPTRWSFPGVTLESGERIVVFASGKDRADGPNLHANFSLNKHSGVVLLCVADGQVVSSVRYGELADDTSYSCDEATGEWASTYRATPGYPNGEDGYEAFAGRTSAAGAVVINEAMPGNDTLLMQGRNQYFDWIELKNESDEAVDLAGYSLTDDLNKPAYCALPAKTLAPGACLVLLCTGDTPLVKASFFQVALSLNAAEERIYLLEPGGTVADHLFLSGIPYGASCGRLPGRAGSFYFALPSPGKENENGYSLISDKPLPSVEPGAYENVPQLTVALSADGDIFYTLDGSTPTERSARYTGPITIKKTTVIRARAVLPGRMISGTATLNYFLNEGHTLPIIAVATDEKNLYGPSTGILATKNLYDRSVERPANVSFYPGGESFSADCGLKLHGASSRGKIRKKSFKVVFRVRYGVSPLGFPVFTDSDTTTFYSLLIRNGEDYDRAMVRDELLTKFAYHNAEELLVQDTRFCVFYLNGKYQGIYCIKEALSSGCFSVRYGVSKDSVQFQRGYAVPGTELYDLLEYARTHDLSRDECYRYVADRINLESLIDWCIYEAYSANHDLSVNIRYYRSPEYDNNRWHYALFDLDYGFDVPATFDYIMAHSYHGNLPRNLMKNETFRDLFLKRMAYVLEHDLTDENVMERFTELVELIRGEMPREQALWGVDPGFTWEQHLASLERRLTSGRIGQMKKSVAKAMGIPLSVVESYFAGGGT